MEEVIRDSTLALPCSSPITGHTEANLEPLSISDSNGLLCSLSAEAINCIFELTVDASPSSLPIKVNPFVRVYGHPFKNGAAPSALGPGWQGQWESLADLYGSGREEPTSSLLADDPGQTVLSRKRDNHLRSTRGMGPQGNSPFREMLYLPILPSAGQLASSLALMEQATKVPSWPDRVFTASFDAVVARLQAQGAELVGELERYENSCRLCDVRGPGGIIVE